MPAAEPRYMRFARALMDVLTPGGIDGFLMGLVVGLGGAVLFAYWFWSL